VNQRSQNTAIDPLRVFIGNRIQGVPVPLVATRFDVVIDRGLAVVTTSRTFRNSETESIEATITFPVPVHATLFALRLRIGDRVLDASAKRRTAARQDYEDAIDRGKTAVLHEELLRGVHMLSVGHVAPQSEIEVRSSFVVALTNLGGRGTLRIPLTVGDIYGHSPLPCSDNLITGGTLPDGDLSLTCRDGNVALLGGNLQDGRARIALNAPIDIEVTGWSPRELTGRAADGRAVALRIEPSLTSEAALDAAIMVDHSGSMGERCASGSQTVTKHDVVIAGLRQIAPALTQSDRIDLWEFGDRARFVGSTQQPGRRTLRIFTASVKQGADLATLARALREPHGGTEIGNSLGSVLAASDTRDLLLITDGKSYQLDVQALARCGRRISVVLVGEDSLEANVGHLAALSGGEIFVANGIDLAAAIESALNTLRTPHAATTTTNGSLLEQVVVRHGGMTLTANWQVADTAATDPVFARAVAAQAAALALPGLESDNAAVLAEAEGLVTHLTSLVLVDEAASLESSLPATRKVALPAPAVSAGAVTCFHRSSKVLYRRAMYAPDDEEVPSLHVGGSLLEEEPASDARRQSASLFRRRNAPGPGRLLAGTINWDHAVAHLAHGNLDQLPAMEAKAIRDLAARAGITDLASKLGLDPVLLVIGLLARMVADSNRSAARISRLILGKLQVPEDAAQLLD